MQMAREQRFRFFVLIRTSVTPQRLHGALSGFKAAPTPQRLLHSLRHSPSHSFSLSSQSTLSLSYSSDSHCASNECAVTAWMLSIIGCHGKAIGVIIFPRATFAARITKLYHLLTVTDSAF
jgi:hypothetical protein